MEQIRLKAGGLTLLAEHEVTVPAFDLDKQIFAYFYSWYDEGYWESHKELRDYPLNRYVSGEPHAIEQQIKQAKASGIDGFIFSYWGTHNDAALRTMLEIAARHDFKVSVLMELLSSGAPKSEREIYSMLNNVISFHANKEAFLRVEGKPVIFLYGNIFIKDVVWKNILSQLSLRGKDVLYIGDGYQHINSLSVFQGLHQYNMFGLPEPRGKAMRRFKLSIDYYPNTIASGAKITTGIACPGCDDTSFRRPGTIHERQRGDLYKSALEDCDESGVKWIAITSWNEFPENTHIEPSEKYGDMYCRITKEFAEKWKRK